MNKYLKEAVLWIILAWPYIYLASAWNGIPEMVPTHFNFSGQPDDWSGKATLLYLPGAMGIGIYILMLVIPYLDPKKKIEQMGGKYYSVRFMFTFFSLLSIYLIYLSIAGSMNKPNIMFALIGVLFAVLGNYFQAIRPNYFIGIRTPWTLESETIWKSTHRLGGRLWMGGGILIVILSFAIGNKLLLAILFGSILAVLTIVPIVFSYLEFIKTKKL